MYSVQDLVLGTLSYIHYAMLDCEDGSDAQDTTAIEWPELVRQQSCDLERMRIDQTLFKDTFLDTMLSINLAKLRVLALRPWRWRSPIREYKDDVLRSRKSSDVVSIAEEEGTNPIEAAEEIASKIMGEGFPCLRIMVIGGHWFWIERNSAQRAQPFKHGNEMKDTSSEPTKLWRFSLAQDDVHQSEEIRRSMSSYDWSFLTEIPPNPVDEDAFANTTYHSMPTAEMTQTRNYVVIRNRESTVENSCSRGRVSRHERDEIDVPSFCGPLASVYNSTF